MAWISVHEQVLGGKLRSLAKEIGCSQNEALGLLVRLWLWGINNADKEGRIIGADKDDIAEVLTTGIQKNISPEKVVDSMVATGWLDFEAGLYIHDWEEWQDKWYKALEVREKDAARKRRERARKRLEKTVGVKPVVEQIPEDALPSPKLNISKGESVAKQIESSYSKDFEEFWSAYPRKVGKGEAYRKYKARLNDGWKEEELLEAVQNYASRCVRDRTEQKYIKHAKTFLSENTPFADYLSGKTEEVRKSSISTDEDDPFGEWRR